MHKVTFVYVHTV